MVAKKEKKTYLAKVVSVKYVEVSPYTYKKLGGLWNNCNCYKCNDYRSKWIDKVIENPAIRHSEESLCYANECADYVESVPEYKDKDAEYVAWHKKEQNEQYDMVKGSGNYDCSCFRG